MARMASLSPTSRLGSERFCRRSRNSLFSATTAWNSSAFCTSARSRFMSMRLGQIIVGALLHRLDGALDRAEGGHEDEQRVAAAARGPA